jgi:hypothetical protein
MKKFFIAIVALAAAVACSNDDIISIDRQAIGFGNAFVENAVRADYSGNLINSFKVYGTVTGNGNTVTLYNGVTVTRGTATYGSPFTCTQTEYWVPNCSYAFQAVVDGAIADGKIAYTVGQDSDNDGISDLLYATAAATTNEAAIPSGDIANDCVVFTFTHLLSKVGFTFTNGVTGSTNYTFKVNSISFTNHDSEGTYTIGTGWDTAITTSTKALSFDAPTATVTTTANQTSTTTHQIIPGEQTLNIAVNYDILYKGQTVYAGKSVSKDLTHSFAQSNVYNIIVALPAPGAEIKFTVSTENGIDAWTGGAANELK